MDVLPEAATYDREVIVILEKNGCRLVRQGRHAVWCSPISGQQVSYRPFSGAKVTSTPYDLGYASVDARPWGAAILKLHLGWLTGHLHDDFKRGRYDALCDLLVRIEPVVMVSREH